MKQGFTLLELIVVMIIIGILVTLGLPQFFVVIEKSKMSEGVATLGIIRQAQLRYASTDGDGYTANDSKKLGIEIGGSLMKYFGGANLSRVSQSTPENIVANISRIGSERYGGKYNLSITVKGDIKCSNVNSTDDICKELGF